MKTKPFKNTPDEELVRQYVDTQKNLYFEYLYERYADKVYRKCLSFVRDTAQAEDFTHDIFMRVVLKIGTFKETAKFSTWLYSITYNYCMDQMRLAKKHGEQPLDENFDLEEDDEDTELEEMQSAGLKNALAQIPADERTILLMKYQDNFSIREIADSFKLTESAVKMRLKRTKEKLKKIYLENIVFFLIVAVKAVMFWKK